MNSHYQLVETTEANMTGAHPAAEEEKVRYAVGGNVVCIKRAGFDPARPIFYSLSFIFCHLLLLLPATPTQ